MPNHIPVRKAKPARPINSTALGIGVAVRTNTPTVPEDKQAQVESSADRPISPIQKPVGKMKPRPGLRRTVSVDVLHAKVEAVETAKKAEENKKLVEDLKRMAAEHGDDLDRENLKAIYGERRQPSFMKPIGRPKDGCSEATLSGAKAYGEELEMWADHVLTRDEKYTVNYQTHSVTGNDVCTVCGLVGLNLQQFPCSGEKGKVKTGRVKITANHDNVYVNKEQGVTWDQLFHPTPTTPQGVEETPRPVRVAPPNRAQVTCTGGPFTDSLAKQFLRVPVKGGTGSHIIVNALAGTGKTFTVVEGTNRMVGSPTPGVVGSDEQDQIWEAILAGSHGHTIHLMAFNRSIAGELAKRIPAGVTSSTAHSFGLKAIKRAGMKAKVEQRKTNFILSDGFDSDHFKNYPGLCSLCEQVCNLIKGNLLDWTFSDPNWTVEKTVAWLIGKYGIEADDKNFGALIEVLPYLMSEHYHRDHIIDYADMIWFPNVHSEVVVEKFDTLIVDEAQDLNKAQQGMVMMAGRRVILVGDRHQAIYGFTGADEESLDNMKLRLGESAIGCQEFPLFETRRCSKAVTALAKTIVPEFRCPDTAPEGKVIYNREEDGLDHVGEKDLVVCRTNAPIISQCLRFLRDGRKARMQGRDMADDLKKLIDRVANKCEDTATMLDGLDDFYNKECEKMSKRKFGSEAALINLGDRVDSVKAFAFGTLRVDDVKRKIDSLFDDKNTEGTLFSSIHRAKGLEADNVVFFQEDKCPHPMARTAGAQKQEMNLRYVAITRAKNVLHMTKARLKPQVEEIG